MKSNYDKYPFIQVEKENTSCVAGWQAIAQQLHSHLQSINKKKKIIAVECYQGVLYEEMANTFQSMVEPALWIDTQKLFKDETVIRSMVYPDVTDDRVFGYLTRLNMEDYFDEQKLNKTREKIIKLSEGVIVVYGSGAALLASNFNVLIYADMPRWEIQQRMRKNEVDNLGHQMRLKECDILFSPLHRVHLLSHPFWTNVVPGLQHNE